MCKKTGKIKYSSKTEAWNCKLNHEIGHVYKCKYCDGYHRTHHKKETVRTEIYKRTKINLKEMYFEMV